MVVGVELLVSGGFPDRQELVGPLGVVFENLGLLVVKLFEHVDTQLVGGSAGRPLEGEVQFFGESFASAFQDALGKVSRRLHELIVIEGDQGLHGGVGALSLQDADFPGRGIEGHEGQVAEPSVSSKCTCFCGRAFRLCP